MHSCSTERIGSTQVDFLACLLELPRQLAYRGGLAYTVDTYHEYHIGLMVAGQIPVVIVITVILCQQRGYLVAQDAVQFGG